MTNPAITVIGIAAMALIAILLVSLIPGIFDAIMEEIAFTSSSIVARDIAGLITISSASTGDISITYEAFAEGVCYNVYVEGGVVIVEKLGEGGEVDTDAWGIIPIGISPGQKLSAECWNSILTQKQNQEYTISEIRVCC